MKLGCQTFTWEMLGDAWTGSTDDILDAIAAAGYEGIEITDKMIGPYAGDAKAFGAALAARGLTLVAFAVATPTGFTDASAFAADIARAKGWLAFAAAFPGAVLSLGSATAQDPAKAGDPALIEVACEIYNDIGRLGQEAGVPVAVHPSSHHGSVLTTRPHYERFFSATDPALVGWVPDTGHILRGGMALTTMLSEHRGRIAYIHLKDVATDGEWRMLGEGAIDAPGLMPWLRSSLGFDHWLVVEEEAEEAGRDPAAAVRRNKATMDAILA